MPSFCRFYFESKFAYNLSEENVIRMLESMKCHFPQSTLNKYIHQIMDYLRVRLEALMLDVMRSCSFVQNDETRILVRSRKSKEDNFKYNTEYIHAALSLEKKLVVMLYKEGSRSREIPEEKIFRGSLIECFTADRAPLYVALEKDLEEYYLQRQACWQHARHYLVDAFVSDHRVQNIAFMYSLYESCKMNDIDFGEYVEDILTRMMNGDDDYRSMIPCYYTPGKKQEKKVA